VTSAFIRPGGILGAVDLEPGALGSEAALADALRRSTAQYRSLVDSMDLGYILVEVVMDEHDRPIDLKYLDANAKAVRMTGAELVGRTTRELSTDFEPHWFETFGRVARTGILERHEFAAAPLNVWYDFCAFKVGEAETRRVVALYQDVTQRKQAVATLRDSAVRQALLLALTDAIGPLLDPLAIQRAATRLLADHLEAARAFYVEARDDGTFEVHTDYRRGDASSLSGHYRLDDLPLVGTVLRAGRTSVIDNIFAAPELTAEAGARFEAFDVRAQIAVPLVKGGRLVAALMVTQSAPRAWTEFEVSLVQETAERTWAAVVRGRSEAAVRDSEEHLRRAHDELEARVRQRTAELAQTNVVLEGELRERRAAEDQIKALFARLVTAQEEERRRIALDVHDHLGQQMTALRLHLEALQLTCREQPVLLESVAGARHLADELDQSIDFLTWHLRPMALDLLGLSDALEQLVSSWSERFHLAAQYAVHGARMSRFRPDVETNLYRLAQEALHNICKHARATCITVSLERDDACSVLTIADDGRGFNLDEVQRNVSTRGMGLVSMRERAALAGGTFQIESSAAGTVVRVTVPTERRSATRPTASRAGTRSESTASE